VNPFKFLSKLVRVVFPVSVSCPQQQGFVSLEVTPREVAKVVINAKPTAAQPTCRADDPGGYKTLDDAIVNAQAIGFRLLGYVEPENLLFAFSESVEVLHRFIYSFLIKNSIPYAVDDLFGPISEKQRDRYDKTKAEPRAIVLCKVVDAKVFQNPIWAAEKKGGEYGNCYEVSWSEIQKLQQHVEESGPLCRGQSDPPIVSFLAEDE